MHPSEQMHWYGQDRSPQYTLIGANGKERPPTLRDAKKLNLVPSVTTIIKCAAAPGLERWKSNQVLLAALTLPRKDGEEEADWLKRVVQDSQEQGRKAAERGTAIHAAIQGHYEGRPPSPEYWPHVKGVKDALSEFTAKWVPERSFASLMGYGGKCDLYSVDHPYVLDFKTKEFGPEDELRTWDEHAMQLAAYREGLLVPEATCLIVYVSATTPGLVKVIDIEEEELQKGWKMFQGLLKYWCAKSGYNPSFEEAIAA
jgi:hypothetical protein